MTEHSLDPEQVVQRALDRYGDFNRYMTLDNTPASAYRDDVDDDYYPDYSGEVADVETELTQFVTDDWRQVPR